MSDDKIDVCRHEDNKDFDQSSYEFLVYLHELLMKEKLGKPCTCEEKHACYLYLLIAKLSSSWPVPIKSNLN